MLHKGRKRVLVNIEIDPTQPPYWAFVPENTVNIPNPPRAAKALKYEVVYTEAEKRERKEPLAYANPLSHGYGGGETPWPFDAQKALQDGRYRAGIRNAIRADWTAQNWKFEARRLLVQILDLI